MKSGAEEQGYLICFFLTFSMKFELKKDKMHSICRLVSENRETGVNPVRTRHRN